MAAAKLSEYGRAFQGCDFSSVKGSQTRLSFPCPRTLNLECGFIIKTSKQSVRQEGSLVCWEPQRFSLQNWLIHGQVTVSRP